MQLAIPISNFIFREQCRGPLINRAIFYVALKLITKVVIFRSNCFAILSVSIQESLSKSVKFILNYVIFNNELSRWFVNCSTQRRIKQSSFYRTIFSTFFAKWCHWQCNPEITVVNERIKYVVVMLIFWLIQIMHWLGPKCDKPRVTMKGLWCSKFIRYSVSVNRGYKLLHRQIPKY